MAKYDPKFAVELSSGIRYDEGLHILDMCRKWGITDTTYYNWVAKYPEFKEAHERGQIDYACWWHREYKDVAIGNKYGNAGCAIFAMKNQKKIGWTDRIDVHNSSDEQVHTINIRMVEGHRDDVVDAEVIDVEKHRHLANQKSD